MAIPKYHDFMLPLLEFSDDGKTHSISEARIALADYFELTVEERKEMLPSGRKFIYHDRISWANTYLKKAGLLESPKRGYFRITERGLHILAENPSFIDRHYLMRFPEFVDFQTRHKSEHTQTDTDSEISDVDNTDETPNEKLEQYYQALRENIENEIIDLIKSCSPDFFENLVVELLVKMGYGGSRADAGRAIGGNNDGGIDGIINEDKLGLDVVYIQAKRWDNTVGRPEIQKFAGALQGLRAKKGIFITTSSFSRGAIEYVGIIDSKIVLIDGLRLARLMFEYDIGVSTIEVYELKRIDQDFFIEE